MRTLSTLALESLNSPNTSEVWLYLLTITHSELANPLRFVNNSSNIVSNGETFLAFPFSLEPPESGENFSPYITLTIANVDRRITTALRTISTYATVSVDVILASEPNNTFPIAPDARLKDVTYTPTAITANLTWENVLDRAFPYHIARPGNTPGLFA